MMIHLLPLIFMLASISAVQAGPVGQLPSTVNLTYPDDKVNRNQDFELWWSVGVDSQDDTTTGIADVGVILPNDTVYIHPGFEFTCGTSYSSQLLTIPGFAVTGRYTAFWNLTFFLASKPTNKGVKPANFDQANCGSGPFKGVAKNFTATFEIADLGANATSKPSSTTITTEFSAPTGTVASNDARSIFSSTRGCALVLLGAILSSLLPCIT